MQHVGKPYLAWSKWSSHGPIHGHGKNRANPHDTAGNNIDRGAFFADVSGAGYLFGIVDFATGENAFFQGNYGASDFLRMNPDGTFSTHLVTNEASASTIDFATFTRYTGTGLMNFDFSGTGAFISNGRVFLIPEPSLNAAVLQGHAKVTSFFTGEDPHRLDMRYVRNPGGQRLFVVTFVPVEGEDVQEQ